MVSVSRMRLRGAPRSVQAGGEGTPLSGQVLQLLVERLLHAVHGLQQRPAGFGGPQIAQHEGHSRGPLVGMADHVRLSSSELQRQAALKRTSDVSSQILSP